MLIGGTDPLELATEVPRRIVHVHLKDVDREMAARVRAGSSYTRAVAAGMYKPLGQGDVGIAGILASLEGAGYGGYYVMEQDTILRAEPPVGSGPLDDVRASMAFLRGASEVSTLARSSFKSPLHEMTQTTPTCLWSDSASISELTYSIENGAVGATCNPVIVIGVLHKEMAHWAPVLGRLIEENPRATEDQLGWMVVEEVSKNAAALLRPIFDAEGGRNGRLSIQTDPRLYRDTEAMVSQAVRFSQLAPNMIVKIPVTSAGVPAIEEATYRGVSINATVSFTLPQCVAVAEAVERGLRRRQQEGKEIASISPVCTIMVGRLDDWLKVVLDRQNITMDPGYLEWAGVAVFKKTYSLFRRARLPHPPSIGRLPQPHALERADRGGPGRVPPVLMAAALQCERRSCSPPH